MPIFAITVARGHNDESFRVVTSPEVPISRQQVEFKALASRRTHPEFAEVQLLLSSSGVIKRHRLKPEKPEAESAGAPAGQDQKPAEETLPKETANQAVKPGHGSKRRGAAQEG